MNSELRIYVHLNIYVKQRRIEYTSAYTLGYGNPGRFSNSRYFNPFFCRIFQNIFLFIFTYGILTSTIIFIRFDLQKTLWFTKNT